MNDVTGSYDVIVIGAGPAGQKASIQASKAGWRALLVEVDRHPGGACVRRGTIPSKTLRETAQAVLRIKRRDTGLCRVESHDGVPLAAMMARVDDVIAAHERTILDQIERNDIEHWHGRARFLSEHIVEVEGLDGSWRTARADVIVVATGSRPRDPGEAIPVDHENVLDSDSILSLRYLPSSMTVLGGGVIASEYASIFAALGVDVTMVDRAPRPLAFLGEDLTERFVASFERSGGTFIGSAGVASVEWDGLGTVTTHLKDGRALEAEKALFALGRVANLGGLRIERAGLTATARGLLEVDEWCRTSVPHIYAVGDVVGPPGLAASAMEQGRRAIRHALGLSTGESPATIPVGIYTLPEIATVGLSESRAREELGDVLVGRADFDELARGLIAGLEGGFLKLIADPDGEQIVGVEVLGERATELVHLGQIAIISGWKVESLVENIFNFPTLAEAYRVAALAILGQRAPAAMPT